MSSRNLIHACLNMAGTIKHENDAPTAIAASKPTTNDNEKEHETANCITYSYAAPPPPLTTCPFLLFGSAYSACGGGNTLFGCGPTEDDRSLLDSSLDMFGLAGLGILGA